MSTKTLVLDLHTYWHAGSGRGDDAAADAVIARDAAGLPYLPGRTLKGLLRAAMTTAIDCRLVAAEGDPVLRWFGSPIADEPSTADDGDGDARERALEAGRFRTRHGQICFGSAQLPLAWRSWAASADTSAVKPVVAELSRYMASTAMNADGVAKDHTLRVREVAVPMTLEAEIIGPDGDDSWVGDLTAVLPLVRSLGTRRNRGYGRATLRFKGGA